MAKAAFDYTPKSLADIVFCDDLNERKITDIINGHTAFPNAGVNAILLYGPPGTGKSTLAAMLPDLIETTLGGPTGWHRYERIYPPNNCAAMIASLASTAQTMPQGHYQYIVLDEVDELTPSAMNGLKSIMAFGTAVFIFATNRVHKIDDRVKDRSIMVDFRAAAPERWLPFARRVMADYGVPDVTDAALLQVVAGQNGSGRRTTNILINFANKVRVKRGLQPLNPFQQENMRCTSI
jgi:replication-associated recombination protein RarA